jgi:2-polyprenyl-6-methoxyphenol hydroxylase-like FAD-dependent oxidoreductase
MSNQHILIIGAGIGGLALAQGLKKDGIRVTVYERDQSAHFRSQGYRIGINSDGGRALANCLPENLFQVFVETSCKPITGRMVSYDSQLQEIFSRFIPGQLSNLSFDSTGPGVAPYTAVNRLTLREVLLAGLDDIVHFDKTLARYEQIEGGQIRAVFTDGTMDVGDLLVGADGSNSVARQQLIPDAKLTEMGHSIYGKTLLTSPNIMEWVPEDFYNGFIGVNGPHGLGMVIVGFRKRDSFAQAAAKLPSTVTITEPQDYLMWSVHLSDFQLSADEFHRADPGTLLAMARDATKDWHPVLQQVVREAQTEATFPITIRYAEPVKHWQTENITLLGDAIHTMPPTRGVGANTALKDAELLVNKLVAVKRKQISLIQAKTDYEEKMLQYGFEAVSKSVNEPYFKSPYPKK